MVLALAAGLLLLIPGDAAAQSAIDYDADDNNLIAINNLAQFNAIRWDLAGDGTPSSGNETNYAAAFSNAAGGMGCAATCIGYELLADLDFDGDGQADSGDTYWNSGSGRVPIGSATDTTSGFSAQFNGHGRAISNLYIERYARRIAKRTLRRTANRIYSS